MLKISPNNKMPAIVDPEGPDGELISVFESGTILIYLSEKTGEFFPQSIRERYNALEWLMFQMGSVGPMLGQAHHFRQYAPEEISYAIDRHLADKDYFVGDYSVVDMAVYPWIVPYENQGQKLEDYPNLARWFERVSDRPAVQRGLKVGEDLRRPLQELDAEERNKLFGITDKK